jgi:phosphoglucomutase
MGSYYSRIQNPEKGVWMDEKILARAREWTAEPFNEETRREISDLIERSDEKELIDRFYKTLEFGTGGMRGIMAPGLNRMNIYTVARATQGLAEYLLGQGEGKTLKVAIAYDSRNNSPLFARESASVLAANGIQVNIFTQLRPTPLLSFTVRQLGCSAGIVITASHNPKEYNGYKVYGADGGQVTSPEDTLIVDHVNRIDLASGIRRTGYEEGKRGGLIHELDDSVENIYLDKVQRFGQDLQKGIGDELGELEGKLDRTGITLIPQAMEKIGGAEVLLEEAQSRPDGNFTTTPSPNPEDPVALTRAMELARRESADLVIATDPDCDRMGLAVPDEKGNFVTLTGNQIGCLLAYTVLASYTKSGLMPPHPVIISTIVSTELIHEIAHEFGVPVYEVLTGFKFIAKLTRELEDERKGHFIYGFEESYGYLAGSFVRDKDGVIGSVLALLMVKFAIARYGSVLQFLQDIYKKYGMYQEFQRSFMLKGAQGAEKIKKLMRDMRQSPPSDLLGDPVTVVKDYKEQKFFSPGGGRAKPLKELPVSDVLQFYTDRVKISVRPSGTEPKIKFYFALKMPLGKEMDETARALQERYGAVSEELFGRYGLE